MTINLIIKPTSACNLRCKYCYHAQTNYIGGKLDISKLEKLLRICCNEYDTINIIWHGGEPLLAGIEYYKNVVKLEKKLARERHVVFKNSIQTNGTLINKRWSTFFKRHNFTPGLSFDGPRNDEVRQKSKEVLRAIKLLKRKKISVGLISVISQYNLDQIALYNYNKQLSSHLKFNPIIATPIENRELDIDVNDYIESTIAFFDYWLYDLDGVEVDPFVYYIYRALGVPYGNCAHGSCLGKWLDIDSLGTIRACGHSIDPLFVLGHIDQTESISQLFGQASFNSLLEKAIQRRTFCMQTCDLFKYCQGGCVSKAFIEGKLTTRNDFSCIAFRAIFSHIQTKIITLLKQRTPLDLLNPIIHNILSEAISLNANEIYNMIQS